MARDDKYLYWRIDFADGKPQWQGSLIDDQAIYCDLVFLDASYNGAPNYNLDLRVQMNKDGNEDSYYQVHKNEKQVASGKNITYWKGEDNLEARIPISSIKSMIGISRSVYVRVYTGPAKVSTYMMSTKQAAIFTGL